MLIADLIMPIPNTNTVHLIAPSHLESYARNIQSSYNERVILDMTKFSNLQQQCGWMHSFIPRMLQAGPLWFSPVSFYCWYMYVFVIWMYHTNNCFNTLRGVSPVGGYDFESSHRYRGQNILKFLCIAKGLIFRKFKNTKYIIFEKKHEYTWMLTW